MKQDPYYVIGSLRAHSNTLATDAKKLIEEFEKDKPNPHIVAILKRSVARQIEALALLEAEGVDYAWRKGDV